MIRQKAWEWMSVFTPVCLSVIKRKFIFICFSFCVYMEYVNDRQRNHIVCCGRVYRRETDWCHDNIRKRNYIRYMFCCFDNRSWTKNEKKKDLIERGFQTIFSRERHLVAQTFFHGCNEISIESALWIINEKITFNSKHT